MKVKTIKIIYCLSVFILLLLTCFCGYNNKTIKDYTLDIKDNPENAEAYFSRGDLWFENGKYDLAIADYSRAIKINPNDAETYNYRGSAWKKKDMIIKH